MPEFSAQRVRPSFAAQYRQRGCFHHRRGTRRPVRFVALQLHFTCPVLASFFWLLTVACSPLLAHRCLLTIACSPLLADDCWLTIAGSLLSGSRPSIFAASTCRCGVVVAYPPLLLPSLPCIDDVSTGDSHCTTWSGRQHWLRPISLCTCWRAIPRL